MAIIYGVNTEKPFKPEDVREAIVRCFTEAHNEVMELYMKEIDKGASAEELEEMKKINVRQIARKAFKDSGGDFENPVKESIMGALGKLKEFAANFRNPELIQKHYGEIMELVNKLQ